MICVKSTSIHDCDLKRKIFFINEKKTKSLVLQLSSFEVAELTWENGQLSMHELGGSVSSDPSKPLWARASGTLESIVHQATCHNPNPHMVANGRISTINIEPVTLSSGKKRTENSCDDEVQIVLQSTKKRSRSQSQSECTLTQRHNTNVDDLQVEHSRCASASAAYFHDATTTTWTSSTSPNCSLNTKTMEDDVACATGPVTRDDQKQAKSQTEAGQSQNSTRRSRVAAVHNQSERRRRDRINQKIRALQKLVPNSSKTDKASMLEEVVEYLKRLQAQIHDMMSINNRTTTMAMQPQMMMPMALQQQQQHQLQMSLLAASMGMGLGMGVNPAVACATPSNAQIPTQPPFLMHPMMQAHPLSASSDHHHIPNAMPVEPYYSFLAQSMNMDLYNKMGAVYRQQLYHHENMAAQGNSNAATSTSQANHARRND
ncbi:hypothetical protein MKX03_035168 [Papaver bracteatum]|nr:hypothetical protein MKX03_035168 [Papaver bracteatum]